MNKINIASLRKSLKLRQKDFGEKSVSNKPICQK